MIKEQAQNHVRKMNVKMAEHVSLTVQGTVVIVLQATAGLFVH